MLIVNWKQVYEINNKWILILYDISKNHYVGLPVYNEKNNNSIYIKSINKYVILDEISDYNRTNIKKCIYIKGKPLKITNKEFNNILTKSKDSFLNFIKNNTENDIEGITFSKWCRDKLKLIKKENNEIELKIGAIYWVDLGYNVGNELRKLRPGILWRSSSNKKMWTIIPLTTKHKDDKYYFHYDLEEKNIGTARIENMINISVNRVKEPYFIKNKISIITKKDNDNIISIIKKYYAFEEIENQNKKNKFNKKEKHQKEKEKSQKVLT